MKKINQTGAAHLVAILVVLLAGIIGFTGWKVYDANKKSNASLDNANKSEVTVVEKKDAKTKTTPDPTADWTSYSNKSGKFSLKYPNTWVRPESEDLCTPELLLLGQSKTGVGKCASDYAGEISISSNSGDIRTQSSLDSKYYTNFAKQSVTVQGVAGERQTATVKGDEDMWLGPAVGTKVTKYIFYTNGRTYIANYDLAPSSTSSILEQFDLLVTKTLKFEP